MIEPFVVGDFEKISEAEICLARRSRWTILCPALIPGLYLGELAEDDPLSIPVPIRDQINKDIARTGLEPSLHPSLSRILMRYAAFRSDVGYVQSMNFLAATALLSLGAHLCPASELPAIEDTAFWVLDCFVDTVLVDYFTNQILLGVHIDQKVLSFMFKKLYPEAHTLLEQSGVMLTLLCTSWMMCAMVGELSAPSTVALWEEVLGNRNAAPLFRTVLAVLGSVADVIVQGPTDPAIIMETIRDAPRKQLDPADLVQRSSLVQFDALQLDSLRKTAREEVLAEMKKTAGRREAFDLTAETHFGLDELERLRAEFDELPKSMKKEGLDRPTFFTVMKKAAPGWARQQVVLSRLFDVCDLNGDGTISYTELMKGLSLFLRGSLEEKLGVVFSAFDKDNSGSIDHEEMCTLLSGVWGHRKGAALTTYVDSLLLALDLNRNGEIEFSEFVQVVAFDPTLISMFFPYEKKEAGGSQDVSLRGHDNVCVVS